MVQISVKLGTIGLPMSTNKRKAQKSKKKSKFDYGGKMFSPDAWKPD